MHVHENINWFTYLRSGLVGICGSISVLCHHQLLCRSRHVMHGVHHDLINWMFLFEFFIYYLISSGCQMEDLSILPFWLKIYFLSAKSSGPGCTLRSFHSSSRSSHVTPLWFLECWIRSSRPWRWRRRRSMEWATIGPQHGTQPLCCADATVHGTDRGGAGARGSVNDRH